MWLAPAQMREVTAALESSRSRHRICKSQPPMKLHTNANTGVDDREQWRARITRALQELRNDDSASDGRLRRDEDREDGAADSTKL